MTEDANLMLASAEQIAGWRERFAVYRKPPDHSALLEWLAQFDQEHLEIAHKLLDSVTIVSEYEIQQGYNIALTQLPGWSTDDAQREGRWYFVGAGGAGESGPAMLRLFREANNMTSNKFEDFFRDMRELPRLRLTAFDHVVMIDDFAGTGEQMANYWPLFQELIASEAQCHLILTGITTRARDKLSGETEFIIQSQHVLEPSADLWSDECGLFSSDELSALDRYSDLASRKTPRGYGECGLAFILSHKTPNNSIPILHANHDGWTGLFPRNLLRAA